MAPQANEKRKSKIPATAQVVDRERLEAVDVKVHSFKKSGCVLEIIGFVEFSDQINIKFDKVEQLIGARVVWRKGRMAGTEFEFGSLPDNDMRSEARFSVLIPAIAHDPNSKWQAACIIRDASKSGCRLQSDMADRFPTDILLVTETFANPIKGKVVWTTEKQVGVQLLWDKARKLPKTLDATENESVVFL